jgi:hypothetical protein
MRETDRFEWIEAVMHSAMVSRFGWRKWKWIKVDTSPLS